MEKLAMDKADTDLMAMLNDAHQCLANGDIKKAADIASVLDKNNPMHPEVQLLNGLICFERAQFQQAERAVLMAISILPQKGQYYLQYGKMFYQRQIWDKAIDVFKQCIQVDKTVDEAYYFLGKIAENEKQIPTAIHYYQQGIAQNPNRIQFHTNLAVIYHKQGKKSAALSAYRQALTLEPKNIQNLCNYGALLTQDRQFKRAIDCFNQVLEQDPNHHATLTNLAGAYTEQGQWTQAEKILKKALDLVPNHAGNWRNLTMCRQYDSLYHPDCLKIQQLLENKEETDANKAQLYFALGKIYQDCQEFDNAFECFEQGNQLRAKSHPYQPESFKENIQLLTQMVTQETINRYVFVNGKKKYPDPIFIVGTPRSGKSLLAEIVAEHPLIQYNGEVGFGQTLDRIPLADRPKGNYPFWLPDLTPEHAKAMKKSYLNKLLRSTSMQNRYVIDTLPGNFMYIGLLAMLFPNAKFIHCKREPLDACLLMHFKYFIQGHYYSHSLEHLGLFYQQYEKMMNHWHQLMGDRILEVEYEDIIIDTEQVLDKITAHLDIDSKFYVDDMRLHTDEVNIHQHYEMHLAPLRAALSAPESDEPIADADELYIKDLTNTVNVFYQSGNFERAYPLAETLLAKQPDNAKLCYILAEMDYQQERYQQAVSYYQQAIEIDSSMNQAKIKLANCMKQLAEPMRAFEYTHQLHTERLQQLRMNYQASQENRQVLLAAFATAPDVILEQGENMLLQGDVTERSEHNHYRPVPLTSPVDDLKQGRYRQVAYGLESSNRIDSWHQSFSVMSAIERLYRHKQDSIAVLEVGCQSGLMQTLLEGNFSPADNKKVYYWGMDVYQEALRERLSEPTEWVPSALIHQDFTRTLPFVNQQFDMIVSFDAISLLTIEQAKNLFKEIKRVLRPKGQFYFSTDFVDNQPGLISSAPFAFVKLLLNEVGFTVTEQKGGYAAFADIMPKLQDDHRLMVQDLLKVHPPEMVAAMVTPLYPECATRMIFGCTPRED